MKCNVEFEAQSSSKLYLKIQFLPQRKHNASALQRLTGQLR
jgi:hypothetical protein